MNNIKIKILSSENPSDLETEINEFFKDSAQFNCQLVSVEYRVTCDTDNAILHSALITYKII